MNLGLKTKMDFRFRGNDKEENIITAQAVASVFDQSEEKFNNYAHCEDIY